jgi:signal transduction histidine kinase
VFPVGDGPVEEQGGGSQRPASTKEQIKALLRRLISIQEDERRRISRDLHDQLGQQLTALRMNLEVFRLQCDLDPPRLKQLERTQRLAEELDQSIDFLTWQLRPAALDDLGLPEALVQLTANWSERLGLDIQFHSTLRPDCRLGREVEENLYRITQEALHNVFKHADPARVSVSLMQQLDDVSLIIEDDGRGFEYHANHSQSVHSLGLISMRERAALIAGEFAVETGVGIGTSIIVRVRRGPEAD